MEAVPALRQNPNLVASLELRQTNRAVLDSDFLLNRIRNFRERFQDLLFECFVGEGGGGGGGEAEAAEPGASGDGDEAENADEGAEERREDDDEV